MDSFEGIVNTIIMNNQVINKAYISCLGPFFRQLQYEKNVKVGIKSIMEDKELGVD